MPRLWLHTIATHREAVRDAAIDATALLVAERGLRGVTMSEIASRTGIGRATLYKYFADVETVLLALHERQIAAHLSRVSEIASGPGSPVVRLRAVLEAYADGIRARPRHGDAELAATLHRNGRVASAQRRLRAMLVELISSAAGAGEVRGDIDAPELADYCLGAVSAAAGLPSRAAARRLVEVTMTGLAGPVTD